MGRAARARCSIRKTGQLLREHLRTRRGFHRIDDDDRPARTPRRTQALLRRAARRRPHIGTLCEQIHRSEGEPGVRRILGVLALAKKHGAGRRRRRRQAALELGAPSYRFLRRYLERRPPVPLTLRQVDPLIRQLTLYRDLIDQQDRRPDMNLVELDHALRKLRLSGMADVLEARLRQAQSENMAPLDLVSALVSDELVRRQDRLFARRTSRRASATRTARSTASTSISTRR